MARRAATAFKMSRTSDMSALFFSLKVLPVLLLAGTRSSRAAPAFVSPGAAPFLRVDRPSQQLCSRAAQVGALPLLTVPGLLPRSPLRNVWHQSRRIVRSPAPVRAAADAKGNGDSESDEPTPPGDSRSSESSEDEFIFPQDDAPLSEGGEAEPAATEQAPAAVGGDGAGPAKRGAVRTRTSILLRPFMWIVRGFAWVAARLFISKRSFFRRIVRGIKFDIRVAQRAWIQAPQPPPRPCPPRTRKASAPPDPC
jgi:hypothetical protein